MYSVIVDGNVLDFKYKRGLEFSYAFYIGDILIGQVFNMGRHDAAEFLLKLNGYK